ncbi:SDR family NAD(P)-dependent oxidoreductase [Halogranum rubrum]|uniref:Short-chain dehydrogenase/reductase SDR n=1 Tax=Halogranum salarium B-1 TaxID=1210908 RepID=J3EUW3_9EURY|nr:SDR family oxidoreductase [Halogranum salarium]EJN58252.1 short-chain dehydrogenase/reductase SDR [Halogranum salarium B-1]
MSRTGDSDVGVALVTGASSGIGLELSRLLAADGYDLVLVARSEDTLRKLGEELQGDHGVNVTVVVKDLARPESPAEIQSALEERDIPVDVLVNNAGFGTSGPFAEADLDRELDEIQVNVTALTELTRRFLPRMVERGEGRILNVASTAAFQPGPYMAVYYATKAYVLSFSEAISEELRGTGVTVTALCPGATETNFDERAGVSDTPLFQGNVASAADVAEMGYRATMDGKAVAVYGKKAKLLTLLVRVTPRRIVRKVVKGMNTA